MVEIRENRVLTDVTVRCLDQDLGKRYCNKDSVGSISESLHYLSGIRLLAAEQNVNFSCSQKEKGTCKLQKGKKRKEKNQNKKTTNENEFLMLLNMTPYIIA